MCLENSDVAFLFRFSPYVFFVTVKAAIARSVSSRRFHCFSSKNDTAESTHRYQLIKVSEATIQKNGAVQEIFWCNCFGLRILKSLSPFECDYVVWWPLVFPASDCWSEAEFLDVIGRKSFPPCYSHSQVQRRRRKGVRADLMSLNRYFMEQWATPCLSWLKPHALAALTPIIWLWI